MSELRPHLEEIRQDLVRREEARVNQQRHVARDVPDDEALREARANEEAERSARQFASANAFDKRMKASPEGQRWEQWRKEALHQEALQGELVRLAMKAR